MEGRCCSRLDSLAVKSPVEISVSEKRLDVAPGFGEGDPFSELEPVGGLRLREPAPAPNTRATRVVGRKSEHELIVVLPEYLGQMRRPEMHIGVGNPEECVTPVEPQLASQSPRCGGHELHHAAGSSARRRIGVKGRLLANQCSEQERVEVELGSFSLDKIAIRPGEDDAEYPRIV